jgi:hypothetical protein
MQHYQKQKKKYLIVNTKYQQIINLHLKHLRYLHLVDPLPRYSDYLQFVGRGPRYCGHAAERDPAKRVVTVFVYRLTRDGSCRHAASDAERFSDCWLWERSKREYAAEWAPAERLLREASVDAALFERMPPPRLEAECAARGGGGGRRLHFRLDEAKGSYRIVG